MPISTSQLPPPSLTDPVWSDDHLVLYFRRSWDLLEANFLKLPTFPRPEFCGSVRMWHPDQIQAWFEDRFTKPVGRRPRVSAGGVS